MTTSTSLVYLIALPLFGATILLLAGRRADKWGHLLATALSASSFGVGLYQLSQMLSRPTEERAVGQKLFSWIRIMQLNQLDAVIGSRFESRRQLINSFKHSIVESNLIYLFALITSYWVSIVYCRSK